MAVVVAFEGKPASGKTTLANRVEEELNSTGIKALEVKRYASENGMLSGMLRKFTQEDIVTRRDTVRSALYHSFNYAGAMSAAKKFAQSFDVILMQRVPWSYLNIMDAMRGGTGAPEFKAAGALYAIADRWARLAKPDHIVYLTAPRDVLERRFADREASGRSRGHDRVHRMLIGRDDAPYIDFLRNYVDGNLHVVRTTDFDAAASAILGIIRRETLVVHKAGTSEPKRALSGQL